MKNVFVLALCFICYVGLCSFSNSELDVRLVDNCSVANSCTLYVTTSYGSPAKSIKVHVIIAILSNPIE